MIKIDGQEEIIYCVKIFENYTVSKNHIVSKNTNYIQAKNIRF